MGQRDQRDKMDQTVQMDSGDREAAIISPNSPLVIKYLIISRQTQAGAATQKPVIRDIHSQERIQG